MGVARVNGAITVVNAIASWKGAAVGIEMEVEARARASDDLSVSPYDPLVIEAVKEALSFVGGKGASVEVSSNIPAGWGLKSSSAVANAVILAVISAYDRRIGLIEATKLSVRAARRAGVTITGAMDDASASMLGGLTVTDNSKDQLIMRIPLPELDVAILLPSWESSRPKSTIDASRLRKYSEIADSLIEILPNRIWEVMTLNGLLYSRILGYKDDLALKAIELGALGAGLSGTGPAIAAVCRDCSDVIDYWSGFGKVMRSRITNNLAKIS